MRIIKVYLFGAKRSDYRLFYHCYHNKHPAAIPTQKHKIASVIYFNFNSSIKIDLWQTDVDLTNFDYMFW
jgi:hypothetical protein